MDIPVPGCASNPPAGGVAQCALTDRRVNRYDEIESSYEATAIHALGFRFSHWMITRQDGTTIENASNPLLFINYHDNGTGFPWELNYISLTAVFVQDGPTPPVKEYNVTTSPSPLNAATTSGAGGYEYNDECTIDTVENCSPWIFDHWELTPGGIVYDKQHTFRVLEDTVCVAKYRHTNTRLPYYDEDGPGNIICTSSGEILYDGDLVNV